jgi:poly(glycerol-phosphate) alpha-glucosyltransferase
MRTLLFLSRVHPKKGLDILLRGFAAYAAQTPDVCLIVAGGDAGSGYLDKMKELASELGILTRCRFLGEVAGETKRQILSGADAFALTSHSEGLPVAVIEAMASGLPVLVTPGCNLPEISDADAGLVVNPEAAEVAAGLKTLFAGDESLRRRGSNGRRLVASQFTWPRIAHACVDAYELMLQENSESLRA